jgi:uncharacterized protein (TIGR03067 family)
MKVARLLLVAASLVVLLGADEAGKHSDLDKLQGTWQVTATEFDGRALSEDMIKDRQIVFKDDTFAAVVGGLKRKTLAFKLDPSKKPKQIDITNPDKQDTAHGIYELTKDSLKLCYGEPGASRPAEFASPAGERVFLITLTRQKP